MDLPPGVPVAALGYGDGVSCMCGWELEASSGGCPFVSSIHRVRALTGLVESSFQGCYSGDHFVVPHVEGPPPACESSPVTGDETLPSHDVALPGCEAVQDESRYCLASAVDTLAALGLDTGTVCPLASAPSVASNPLSPTLAWRGEAAYTCSFEHGLLRTSLRDGVAEVGCMRCSAVAVDDADRLLSVPQHKVPPRPLSGETNRPVRLRFLA